MTVTCTFTFFMFMLGFPGGTLVKNVFANAGDTGDLGLIPRLVRYPGEGDGNLLQYSCLEKSKDKEACWARVHGIAKGWT